jgi:hypothetical protein
MLHDAQQQLRERYRSKAETEPPSPWQSVQIHVGGVTAVGFGAGSDLLLVLTHSGLGVVDVATGSVVARNVDDDQLNDDPYPIYARGITPLDGQRIPLAGLWGGGLRTTAPDGWVVHRVAPSWPAECAILCPPDHPEIDDEGTATMLVKDLDPPIRALGFSDTGNSLVVANTMLYLWRR